MQLLSGLTRFRSMFIKPYFQSKNTYDVKLDELEVIAELDELEATAKLDKLEVPLPTLKVSQKPTKLAEPVMKCG